MSAVVGVACPQIVYPYLRGNVADVVNRAGFPPVHLAKSTSRPCTSSNRPRPPPPAPSSPLPQ